MDQYKRAGVTAITLVSVFVLAGGCNWLPWNWGKEKARPVEKGDACFYADRYAGNATASGEKYSPNKLTAAHRTLPFGSIVLVKNLRNGLTVKVRINDRGPFSRGRIIDLSRAAAEEIDMIAAGVVPVRIEVLKWGPR